MSAQSLQKLFACVIEGGCVKFVIVKGAADLLDQRERLGFVPLAQDMEQLVVNGSRPLEMGADTVPDRISHGIDHVTVACGVTDPVGVVVGVVPSLGVVEVVTQWRKPGASYL